MWPMMTRFSLICWTLLAITALSSPALAETPESTSVQETPAQEVRQRPSAAGVASDTALGETIALELSKALGVAMSPAVGLAVVGLWYRATSDRPERYWYASWWFIAIMSSLALLVAAKDTLGSIAGPAKQIADAAEVLLNNGAGLIALAATLSWVVEPLGAPATELAQGAINLLAPTAHAATEGARVATSTGLAAWLGTGLLAGVTTMLFAVVWLVSQTFNVMIMLNPFSPLDPFLKGARLMLIGALVLACALGPWLGIPFAVILVLLSFFVSGYCLRMMSFGTVMAWDLARGAGAEEIPARDILAFAGRGLSGVPTRTLGRLTRSDPESLCFQYRPWFLLPRRSIPLESASLYAVDGSMYPSLYEDPEGRTKAIVDLAPRARRSCESLAALYLLAGTGESWLKRQTTSARSGGVQMWRQMGGAWTLLTR